jgi:hypothetical protein
VKAEVVRPAKADGSADFAAFDKIMKRKGGEPPQTEGCYPVKTTGLGAWRNIAPVLA